MHLCHVIENKQLFTSFFVNDVICIKSVTFGPSQEIHTNPFPELRNMAHDQLNALVLALLWPGTMQRNYFRGLSNHMHHGLQQGGSEVMICYAHIDRIPGKYGKRLSSQVVNRGPILVETSNTFFLIDYA